MKNMCARFMLLISMASPLYAADLMDIYSQALDNDTTFKMAYSTFMSNSEYLPQAKAALLPQLTAKGQTSANQQNISAGIFSIKQPYRSLQWQLLASQSIFNYQAWAQVQKAKAGVKSAHATFNAAAQDLIIRTLKAYLNVLYARDSLSFSEAKKRANKRQLDQATQRFNVGLEPITSVYNAQSAFDQSTADVIDAENNVVTQQEGLRRLTNHSYDDLAPLRNKNIPLISPEPSNSEDWVASSLRQNYNLLASKFNLQAARENIKALSGGNWPVFAIEGNTTSTTNQNGTTTTTTTNTQGNRTTSRGNGSVSNNISNSLASNAGNIFIPASQQLMNVAVTVRFPLFQGGLVESQTRQAQFNFQTMSEQLEDVYRSLLIDTRVTYNSIMSSISKIKADRQTLMSQENTVQSTESQFLVGTRTMVDVVNAQQHLYEAQLQLARDQYDYMNNILKLKNLAGSLNVADLEEINAWLATTQINQIAPIKNNHKNNHS